MARAWVDTGRRPASNEGVVAAIYDEFPVAAREDDVPHDWFTVAQERRAALNLHAFTGLAPRKEDDGRRDAAVDLVLHGENSRVVVEVTSSASDHDEKIFDRSERLAARVNALYEGGSHWALHFRKGYAPPSNRRGIENFAASVVSELRQLDVSSKDSAELVAATWLSARKVDDGKALVEGVSWDSRVTESDTSYVEVLREFLDTDLIRSKQAKLLADGVLLQATERHLCVFTAPTGANAHVFPRCPWAIAGVRLELPDGIDVLWIDTRSTYTYRYSERDGVTVLHN